VLGIAIDVTERNERERKLDRARERMQLALDQTQSIVFEIDFDTGAVVRHGTYGRFFDHRPEEIPTWQEHCEKAVHPDDRAAFRRFHRELIEGDRDRGEIEYRTVPDPETGEYRWISATVDVDGAPGRRAVGISRDVTERVRRERRLEALHETTQELMAADRCERVAEIGVEAAREILGLEMNSVHLRDEDDSGLVPVAYTEDLADLIGEPPTFTGEGSIAWRSFERGEAFAVDDVRDDPDVYDPDSAMRSELYLPLGQDGLLIAGSTRPSAFDEQDLVLGKILAGNLATALEQVSRTQRLRARERELARRNEHLESFANILSHDLRGPLNVAMGQLELTMAECDNEHLPTVQRSLERMETLIEDLLTLAREGDTLGEVESVDLAALVRTCWRTVETGGATLDVRTERTLVADRSRLRQVIENLLRNAVEHGSPGGRPSDGLTITVGDMAEGFYVADDGSGIPLADREAVFDTGYSTASDGTGLGLRIVERIAGAHGWEVSVDEGADGGTRIEVIDVENGATRPPD
jgi:signal transduction histidine kinase